MNFKKLISLYLVLELISGVFITPVAQAFDAATTHKKLTEKAIELKIKEHQDDPEFLEAFGKIENGKLLLTDNGKLIRQGSEEEDYPEPRFINFV